MNDQEQIKPEGIKKGEYDARFSGVLGSDYGLRYLAMPYNDEFQGTIKDTLKTHFADKPDSEFNVVEAGCGTGITTIRILDADPRIKIVAIDNEKKMIEQAEQTLADLKDRVKFVEADILSVLEETVDASVDAFSSCLTIHNFPAEYREKVIGEVARVLKSGGIFINADKYAFDDLEAHLRSLDEQIQSFDVFDTIGRPDVKEAWTKHYHQDENTKITESEQIKILEDLGFEDIKVIFRKSMEAVITARKK